MPIYEYKCEGCGDVFERMQRFSDEPLTTHDKCGGPVHRLLSAPALQFKGSGWYITDYARSNAPNGSDKSKSEGKSGDSGSGSSDSAKTESSKSDSSKSESNKSSTSPSTPATSSTKKD